MEEKEKAGIIPYTGQRALGRQSGFICNVLSRLDYAFDVYSYHY